MRRRSFITLLSGAAASWPLAAHAQQAMRRIGILMPYLPSDPDMQARVRALQQELQKLGWTKGANIQFDERWTSDNMDLVRASIANLVELKPDIIVATGGRVVPILMQATRTIPIVVPGFGDPVRLGLIDSLARPGGNVTGFTIYEYSVLGRMLDVLKQIAPGMARVAVIHNPDNPSTAITGPIIEGFARSLGIEAISAPIHGMADVERAIQSLARQGNGGVLFQPDLTTTQLRGPITALVARHRLPAIYSERNLVISGGLVSYDSDRVELYRRAASYVDRILRGEKPSDLPVQQPTKYHLAINLKTARAIGVEIPVSLLSVADEVIE